MGLGFRGLGFRVLGLRVYGRPDDSLPCPLREERAREKPFRISLHCSGPLVLNVGALIFLVGFGVHDTIIRSPPPKKKKCTGLYLGHYVRHYGFFQRR